MAASRGGPSFPLLPVLLLGCAAFLTGRGSGSSSHSLRYFYTAVSEPGEKEPQFFAVGYVDDQHFVSYDAKAKRRIPTVPWIRKVDKEDPEYWERNSQIVRNAELGFQADLVNVARYYNQSGGTHTWQWMYGCELRRDGSRGGYEQYAYDGRDYISFDKETLTWTAADVPAQNTKRKWEAERANVQFAKDYMEGTCIEWLQRYLEYGKETLLRTEKPEVTVTRKEDYDGMETLICRVGGFYPKEIDIDWTRDGEVWLQDTYHGLVSPNSDGTYYTWRSIKVDPKEKERYKCHVEHDGLLKPVDVAWEEPASNLWVIIACVVGVLVLLLAAGIAVYFKQRQNVYKEAPVRDQDSNSSGTGSAVPI
nr:H-2 class I histocompatibility antigen, Q9 alpha chain-like [Anolis sagrei ordinatus]XP_060615616.1 H-2 class I histocompatibility antigen, Q9 alpha chain-like [Anolis sagrei ordinatus]XP_060615617.1 H-2 class I histocompatibility antigen, Q9 alpha chain-like [Anolis sagrei ordinatus]